MYETRIKEALNRIRSALNRGRMVTGIDGTCNSAVVGVDGEQGFRDNWLTVQTSLFGRQEIPVGEGVYCWYLNGWTLRDTKDALYIGPSWYLESWPCTENCDFSCNGKCQVKNCAYAH